jgi:hypothetical protein
MDGKLQIVIFVYGVFLFFDSVDYASSLGHGLDFCAVAHFRGDKETGT